MEFEMCPEDVISHLTLPPSRPTIQETIIGYRESVYGKTAMTQSLSANPESQFPNYGDSNV